MSKDLTQITNYEEITTDLLISQFKEKPNINKFATGLSMHANDIEDAIFRMKRAKNINTAVGKELDDIGVIEGIEREGLGDEEYRDEIKFYIILNRSGGESEILMSALKLFSKSKIVDINDHYPAEVIGYIEDLLRSNIIINAKMKKICAGGVKYIGTVIGKNPFGFSVTKKDGTILNPTTCKGYAMINRQSQVISKNSGNYCMIKKH